MSKLELYLALGSNSGDRKSYLETALERLDQSLGCHYRDVSSFLETEPWGFDSQDKFLNAVVVYELAVFPNENSQERGERILDICKDIERSLGRTDAPEYDIEGNRIYHSRTIDIDIIFIGTDRIDTERLTVPHRLAWQRDFVMNPLKEIASQEIIEAFPDVFFS